MASHLDQPSIGPEDPPSQLECPTQPTTEHSDHDTAYPPYYKRNACTACRRMKSKCDMAKPSCGACSKFNRTCAYETTRKKSGPKRGYTAVFGSRLAHVEALLSAHMPSILGIQNPSATLPDEWVEGATHPNLGDGTSHPDTVAENDPSSSHSTESAYTGPNIGLGMISLELEESLPDQEVIDELYRIYFEDVHIYMPIIHHHRHLAALDHAPHARPPICLQYMIWCHAALVSDKFNTLHAAFYERARKYAEADEMKGYGGGILSLAHAQTWLLITAYEYKMMFFPRAWLSCGKACRLAIMLGFHQLDSPNPQVKQCFTPSIDWVEKEERRRVFWMTFCIDKFATIGTGWPVGLSETEVMTNLAASDEAFITGQSEPTARLSDVLNGEGLATLSPSASIAFVSCIFGRITDHLRLPQSQDDDSYGTGGFWQRHRSCDEILLNFALAMPNHLRLPNGMGDPNIIFCNIALHTAIICLHQAAIFRAEWNNVSEYPIVESKLRCTAAAQQVLEIIKMVGPVNMSKVNPFASFCIYVAARVYVQRLKLDPEDTEAHSAFQSFRSVIHTLKTTNPLAESFLFQLDVDSEGGSSQGLRLPTNNFPVQMLSPSNL
ncbi:fungal-specific transcription factor domain-containing protein [Aspergillus pseudotamarii]|uniref:Fungal-specific transcription factor domain-containing protein n=1 Tax=Aspergillus pseudotamarii TaxID=132259 RepID=A0A5N6STB9_ASPPS|nr:fungal-specific transcription factor domain-containing protein [Aspergillus pseudotamarii]KAE8137928.1 fungal-specific transcription factor domain-containing protein [Aspergillus pseudotamarii]